jgi:glycine dehydrogenase subunit 1
VNRGLRAHGIFGGKELPELGNAALYCVTEVHTKGDIERLAAALEEVIA